MASRVYFETFGHGIIPFGQPLVLLRRWCNDCHVTCLITLWLQVVGSNLTRGVMYVLDRSIQSGHCGK